MPAVAEERVLVVPTSRFHSLGYFQGFSAEMSRYLPALLEGDDLSYRPRGEMEQDPSFKQLIPYMSRASTRLRTGSWATSSGGNS